jgi:hypothetical protein
VWILLLGVTIYCLGAAYDKNVQISEKTLTDQNCMHEEIKTRLHSVKACYRSVQSLLSCHLLSGKVNFKINKNHNSASCFVCVWNLFCNIKGRA